MSAFDQAEQDEITERYNQEEANAAEESAVELLNTLRDTVADIRGNRRTNLKAADSLIERIEETAHRKATLICG